MKQKKKIVFVIGQESSGSRLVARACAHSLDIIGFEDWKAVGWTHSEKASVCHRSLPFGTPSKFPDIRRWLKKYCQEELYFVITTRDVTLSDYSKMEVFGKPFEQVMAERNKVREIIAQVMESGHPYTFVSYETLMFLGKPYWGELYAFLDISPANQIFPALLDANAKRIEEMTNKAPIITGRSTKRVKRQLRGSMRRALDKLIGEAD